MIIVFFSETVHHFWKTVSMNLLSIGCDVLLMLSVTVESSHLKCVFAQSDRYFLHDVFNIGHPLGTAKTTKSRVGWKIGATDLSLDQNVGDEIGIIRMEHGSFHDCRGKICISSPVGKEFYLQSCDSAFTGIS